MAFSETYCNALTGSNMNGGSDENASPSYSATNGGWNSGTGVFTPATGDPSLSAAVGQYANVFVDGSTTPVFVGRVTAVSSTTITISTTAKSGTAPTTAGSGISINVGGAWKGQNSAVSFPFGFITNTLVNAAGDIGRCNLKNNATYSITAVLGISGSGFAGPYIFEGYSSVVGDGGRAVIDGGTSGASFSLLNLGSSIAGLIFKNIEFKNNGATGNAGGIIISGAGIALNTFIGCVIRDVRGSGITGNVGVTLIDCEIYGVNQSNTAVSAAVNYAAGPVTLRNCLIHDNSGSNTSGIYVGAAGLLVVDSCVFDSNGAHGIAGATSMNEINVNGCDFYNNAGDGIRLANTSMLRTLIQNSNFVKNGGYGINGSGLGSRIGLLRNCGFGAGTQANTSGASTGLKGIVESDSVNYASNVTPWVDPANGDFRINLAAAKGTGRGVFTQTASSYAGSVGYPDIGACQHSDSGSNTYIPISRPSRQVTRAVHQSKIRQFPILGPQVVVPVPQKQRTVVRQVTTVRNRPVPIPGQQVIVPIVSNRLLPQKTIVTHRTNQVPVSGPVQQIPVVQYRRLFVKTVQRVHNESPVFVTVQNVTQNVIVTSPRIVR